MFVTCPRCGTTKALDSVERAGWHVACSVCQRVFAISLGEVYLSARHRDTRLRCPSCGADHALGIASVGAVVFCTPCQRVWKVWSIQRAAGDGPDVVEVRAGVDDGLEPTPLFDLETPREEVLTLLDAVCDSLTDDAPRLVLADCLLELNDRLGEFIVLQLSAGQGAAKEREAELLKAHRSLWVPPGVDPSSAHFHRGLLQSCRWSSETDSRHFAWRTVETLHVDHGNPGMLVPQTPFRGPRLALQTLTGVSFLHVNYLRHCSLPQLRTLELTLGPLPLLKGLLEVLARLPSLRVLSLIPYPNMVPHFDIEVPELEALCVALGPTVTDLKVRAPAARHEALAAVVRRHVPRVTLELTVSAAARTG